MKKLLGAFSITILIIFISGCGKDEIRENADSKSIPVKVIKLQKEEFSRNINASGQFTTDDETYLSFKTGGFLKKIFVKEGDAIVKGQLLATLDLTEINANVSQAEIGFEKALRDYNRVSNLYNDSVATRAQLQDAQTAMEIAKQQLSIAKYNQGYSEIRAISSGFVLNKMANEGQLVESGMPILRTNGAGKNNWFLKIGVSDKQWASIKIGDAAFVTSDAYLGQKLSAVVERKSEGVNQFSGTFSLELRITDKNKTKLASGMFGKAEIQVKNKTNGWLIPYESLLDGDGNNGFVFVTNDNKTVQKVQVSVTDILHEKILVTGGLENSTSLIVSGSAYLKDGSLINVQQ